MKVLSLFSGIGAFEKALTNLNADYELVGFSEIDKYAVKSYCAIHNVSPNLNLGDITQIDGTKLPKDIDLITYGFPCQDISIAGKQKGLFNSDETLTRSGLFFETLRIIKDTKPKIAIAENVKNLVSKKFQDQFELILSSLDEVGYNTYYQVLNAKNYGIPQNRERVFLVSIRKDIDKGYEFPKGFPLELRLKDMLDEEVEEKFYLNDAQIKRMETTTYESGKIENRCVSENGIIGTLCARDYKDPKCVKIGDLCGERWDRAFEQNRRVFSPDHLSPTIVTQQGGGQEIKILTEQEKIRKVTPKECFRLMGFTDEDFTKAEKVNSNSQLYKQAGNSVVVQVAEKIMEELINGYS